MRHRDAAKRERRRIVAQRDSFQGSKGIARRECASCSCNQRIHPNPATLVTPTPPMPRVLGKTIFVVLKDCSGEVQWVAAPESIKEHHLKLEDTVEIVGRVRGESRAKLGYELDILRVLNRSGPQLPFTSFSDLDSVNAETLVEYRPLALRNAVIGNVFRVQAALLRFFRE
jgi:hypothetical protein